MFELIEPNNILRRYIKNYCVVEINNSKDFLPIERVYPNGNICMVFHYGSPSKFKKRNSGEYVEPAFVVCGLQTNYYDLSLSGKTGMILVIFKPQGFTSFFNFPAKDISNENISLNLLIGNGANVLEDKLLNSGNNKERIAQLENFLLERLTLRSDFERIDYALRLIEASKGQIKTQKLSQEVCLGIKQFERIFSNHVGINPKKFANIIRFQNVLQMKRQFKELNMFQLAFDNGYYDQSHFIRDFKRLTGLSPRDFFNTKQ